MSDIDGTNMYMHMCFHYLQMSRFETLRSTVMPAKSDGDVMFCLQSYQGIRIDRSLVYQFFPQDRINTQVIY